MARIRLYVLLYCEPLVQGFLVFVLLPVLLASLAPPFLSPLSY